MTDKNVAALSVKAKAYTTPDPELAGHYVRVRPTGVKTFAAVARDPNGKQVWVTIGASDLFTIEEAREKAREEIRAIKAGSNCDGITTFEQVAEQWFKRHVEAKKLISAPDFRSVLNRHLLPAWSGRDFASIRRGDVASLLDSIEDSNGAATADYVLAVVRMICNFRVTRDENYTSPIVKGMRKLKPTKRDRVLDDDEIRAVWTAAESNGTFGAFIRLALLTAQRREKVVAMRWEDLGIDGEWRIPTAEREKGTAGSLVLPEIALEIIRAQPHFESNPYVLAGRGAGYIQGQSKRKAQFDAKLIGVKAWTIHDLRRSARSLMSRAGVRPDVAERVLGHAIAGVEGVYDRHKYNEEKAHALKALAGLIDNILRPESARCSACGVKLTRLTVT